MSRHDLPSGGWVELRDPKLVSERLRRPVLTASTRLFQDKKSLTELQNAATTEEAAALVSPEFIDGASVLNDLVAVALVSAWSFDTPVNVDSLLDLTGPDYDEIRAVCSPLLIDLLPDFSASSDPKAQAGT